MIAFQKFAGKLSPLEEEALEAFANRLEPIEFSKGDDVVSRGNTCRYFFFLEQGLVKYHFANDAGREIILRFFRAGMMFTSLESFLTESSTEHVITAIEPVKALRISKANLEELCKRYHSVERFYRKLLSMASVNMVRRISELLSDNATMRYERFLSEHQDILQRISLGDLANYIGVTQVSLSRIRAQY